MFLLFRYRSDIIYKFTAGEQLKGESQWGCAQQLVFWMVFVHYIKKVFEALAVHYSKQTTMGHNILAYKISIEWIFVGFGIAYYLFNPKYSQSRWISSEQPFVFNLILGAFICVELMSLLSDIHLSATQEYRDLHPEGNQLLSIP